MAERARGADVTVLVAHRDDEDARAMLDELEVQVQAGNIVEHLRIEVDHATDVDAALWSAHRAGRDSEEDEPLFTRLSAVGRIDRLRMVAITTLHDAGACRDLDRGMDGLSTAAARLLTADRQRTHVRLAIMGYGEESAPPVFFSALADVNAIVLPYDRLEDASIARPVERTDATLFRTHGAVELASAAGLWRTMDRSPLDDLRGSAAGGAGPRVRFLQSRVRVLRTPPVPVADLVAEQRELPIPDGYLPAPDLERLTPRLADMLLPPELIYESAAEPRIETQQVEARTLLGILGREVLHSFAELPQLVWRSVGGEVSTLTRRALQQAIGADSRYRVIDGPESEGGGSREVFIGPDGDPIDFDTVVAEPEVLARFDPIPGEIWVSLVAEVLGTIDGDPDCRDLREQALGDPRFLPVDRQLLLGGLDQLPPALVRMLELREASVEPAEGPETLEDQAEPSAVDEEAPADSDDGEAADGTESDPAVDIVNALAEEQLFLMWLTADWDRVADVAGELWQGARATYRAARPVSYVGGILTLSCGHEVRNPAFHVRRAQSQNFVSALHEAIGQVVDMVLPLDAIDVIPEDGSPWQPLVHLARVARIVAGTDDISALDELLGVAGLDEVAADQSDLRSDALDHEELDRLSGLIASSEGAEMLRGYAAELRRLLEFGSTLPPSPPPPSGLPFLDMEPPDPAELLSEGEGVDELASAALPWDVEDDEEVDPLVGDVGLLVGVRQALRRQQEAAARDVARILETLRDGLGTGPERVAVSPAVPISAGIGAALLLIWLGGTDLGIRAVEALNLTEGRRDAIFTTMTVLIVIGASSLTDLGKRLGGQTRTIVLTTSAVLVISGVLLFFEDLRQRVPIDLRESNVFAVAMATVAIAVVMLALLQSLASGDPLRVQGSRILVASVAVYAVLGIIAMQVQSQIGLAGSDVEAADRISAIVLAVSLTLVIISVIVLALVRFRAARQRDDRAVRHHWAVDNIGPAVDARERLRAAEQQWMLSMVAIAQVLRQPFGPLQEPAAIDEKSSITGHVALKAASVQVRLTDRGRSDLESRIRQLLVGPSWLRRRYQAMVDGHQRLLATRLGMPIRSLVDRRPEADPVVPTDSMLRTGRGRGDRLEFVRLAASGAFDADLSAAVQQLDVRTVFDPMLAEPDSHLLEGFEERAQTVEEYFHQVLPEVDPALPTDTVRSVLAAQDRRRMMRPNVWWPTLMAEPRLDLDDVPIHETGMFRHGTVGGAGMVAVRVDVSEEFPYDDLANATSGAGGSNSRDSRTDRAADPGVDYGSDIGL